MLAGGGYRHGQHIAGDRDRNTPLCKLFVSMLQRFGVELDQFVVYLERMADMNQTDHIDWGFRVALLYGLDYRFMASRGYAVLQPNFRGSSGYGWNFVQAGDGEWAGKVQYDVEDGV